MRTDHFDYQLPQAQIAKEPVSPRDHCRLMVLDRKNQTSEDYHFFDLERFLNPGDVLVFNNSKVLPARIIFPINGKKVEIFLLRQVEKNKWLILGKPGKALQIGVRFKINEEVEFEVEKIFADGTRLVQFFLEGKDFDELLEKIGEIPLPPYIKNSEASFDDYQTIYAKEKGSVAAPTAGLHFTDKLLQKLKARGVQLEFVTLHVGAGTFFPIKSEIIEDHSMHSEFFHLDQGTAKRLNQARKELRRIVAVGTTSVRVLESNFKSFQQFQAGTFNTNIFIYPGYEWQCVNGLITNFHLPKSTLLLLTCAFGGEDLIMKSYKKAVQKGYRFYSFGDAMFIS